VARWSVETVISNRECEVLLAVQNALLGEVSAQLRAVLVRFSETTVDLDFYFDGDVSEDDQERASVVETEVIAALPETDTISHTVTRLDHPARIPGGGTLAYHRSEPFR
jgi:hypothetical protein